MNRSKSIGEIPLSRLIQDLEDGTISPADRTCLMDHLRHDPAARELYLKHIRLAAMLRQTAETRHELGTMPVSMDMLARAKRKSAITALVGGIAAVLVLALTLMAFQVRISFASRAPYIAMESSQDATYEIDRGESSATTEHDSLRPGDRITVARGVLRFTFPSKVEAIIEGPADLELLSASEIRLDGGSAWFRVPREGRGFTVRTDRAKIIDLGTEFGLWFDQDRALQVHVAQGKVLVKKHSIGAADFSLSDGEAVQIDADGRHREVETRPGHFRREFTHAIPYAHWSFDYLVSGAFPAIGTMPDVADYRAHVRRADGEPAGSPQGYQAPGIRGNALALNGDGHFAESAFPGIAGNIPRTVAAWIRHRPDGASAALAQPVSDPRLGHGATTPFGDQAYLLGYTNSGLVTAQGAIGETLQAGTTYNLSFHAAALPEMGRADYLVELVAFDPTQDDAARMNMRHGPRVGAVLAQSAGHTILTDMTTRDEIEFTARADDPHLGMELAIRIVKSGNAVLYDNLRLTRKSSGASASVIFEESFESPTVTGYAEQILPNRGWVGPIHKVTPDHGFGAARHGLFSQRPVYSAPYLAWDGGSGARFTAFVLPTKPFRWSVADGGRFSDADPLVRGEWTHVATVHTGRILNRGVPEVLHYINGQRAEGGSPGHANADSPLTDSPATLHIGMLPGAKPAATLQGDIDELFIFRGALDESEIQSLMDQNRAVFSRER